MTARGVYRGVGPVSFLPHWMGGGGDPALDGGLLVADSSREGGMRLGLGSHGAEYTFSFAVATGGPIHTVTSGWTLVEDTDNFGSTINSNGQLIIPSGLGGRYNVTAFSESVAIGASIIALTLQKNAADVGGSFGPNDAAVYAVPLQGAYSGKCAVGDAFTVTLIHNMGSTQTFTGRMCIDLFAPSTA